MKKLNLLKPMLITCLLFILIGSMWGTEVVYKTVLFGSSYNSKGISSYSSSFSATNNGFTVDVTNFNNSNNAWSYVKTGNKTSTSVGTIATTSAIDKPITKVVVTIDAITVAKVSNITLYSGSTNSCTTNEGTFSLGTGEQAVAISAPAANRFYSISFSCEKGSSNGLVTVSKVEFYVNEDGSSTPSAATPTFSVAAGTYSETQSVALSTTTEGASIYYTTNGEDPTTSSTLYSTPISVSATTTIKAIAVKDGMSNSSVATATYTIEASIANTAETAYTVEEAIALIDANSAQLANTMVYVTGIVSEIVTEYSSQYGNITFNISATGETNGQQFQFFRNQQDATNKYTSDPNIRVGATVIGCGKLTKYNDIYEFASGNYNVSYTAPAEDKQTPTITAAYETALTVGTAAVYTVNYNGDGTLSVTSSNTEVATVALDGTTITVTPIAAGTTQITISATGTENCYAANLSYSITVTNAPYIPSPATEGYETVDFTSVYSGVTDGSSATVEDYEGTSFTMEFAKPQSSTTPTKYYTRGASARAYKDNTITITGAENIIGINIAWSEAKGEDTDVQISGIGTTTVLITFSNTCSFTSIKVRYHWNYTREVAAGKFGTICLDHAVTKGDYEGATFYSIAGKRVDSESNVTAIVLEEVTSLEAGKPYIFEATGNLSVGFDGTVAAASSENGLVGSLEGCSVAEGMYILSNNQVKKCGTGCQIGANRAYINMDEVPLYRGASSAPVRVIAISEEANTATALENTNGESVQKIVENGQVYIIRAGVVYDIIGRIVK